MRLQKEDFTTEDTEENGIWNLFSVNLCDLCGKTPGEARRRGINRGGRGGSQRDFSPTMRNNGDASCFFAIPDLVTAFALAFQLTAMPAELPDELRIPHAGT
jgi:hypothetical protein